MTLLISFLGIISIVLLLVLLKNKSNLATQLQQEKQSFLAKIESLLIENARYQTTIESLQTSSEKLEQGLQETKNLYTRTQELLYQEKQNLELKHQEMKSFELRVSDWEKSRHEAITQAKAAIFETASTLSKELLESHKKETQESETKLSNTTLKLQEQFEKIVNNVSALNNDIKSSKESVDHIKAALLSPTGAGNLAEITLENILKASGLHPNRDFIMQYSFATISQDKSILRPDAVIFLPNDNIMIVDSKFSKHFSEITSAQDAESLKQIEDKIKATMRQHLKSLSDKNYSHFLKENLVDRKIGHISNIMFLPSESVIEKISHIDKDFTSLAWEKNIFPVGPSGLLNLLIQAKLQISAYTQSENQLLIIDEVKKLLNAVAQLYEHTKKLGNSLHSTTNNFDKLAGSFNANFLPKARALEKFGINSNKTLPSGLERLTVISSNKIEILEEDMNPKMKITHDAEN